MPAPFQNSLTFNSVADIKFTISATEVKIHVGTQLLGTINNLYPVSVYVVISGNVKTLWMKEIAQSDYTQGNSNNPNSDTIQLPLDTPNLSLTIDVCPSNNNKYKIIGWETDTVGQICAGGNGTDTYYDISNYLYFKAKIEPVTDGSSTKDMMVTRYPSNVNVNYSGTEPRCASTPYCYVCRP